MVNGQAISISEVDKLVAAKEQAAREQLQGAALADKIKEIRQQAVNDLMDRQRSLQESNKKEQKAAEGPRQK